jgi:RNA polymerase sigma factor (sigma-70 family)
METTQLNTYFVNLVDACVSGDEEAYKEVIKISERLVSSIIVKMIANKSDHEDVAQEIYLRVFRSLTKFKHNAKLTTWIAQIAYNSCLTHLEKRKLPLTEDGNIYESHMVNTVSEVREKNTETSAILHSAILKLPPLYNTLISLYHQEELSIEEIADITNLPEGTIKNYLYRARKLLKDIILKSYKKEDL